MADFTSTQSQLAAARAAQDAAQLTVTQAAARARQAQDALDLATRQTSPHDDSGILAKLSAAAEHAAAEQAAAQKSLDAARGGVVSATGAFAEFSTPQQNVSQLPDNSPFLLFPVRIETRFRTVSPTVPSATIVVTAPPHQLLVRIYPDDCSIDTFEPMPSDSELADVKSYWMNIWRAGGRRERSARGLEPVGRGARLRASRVAG